MTRDPLPDLKDFDKCLSAALGKDSTRERYMNKRIAELDSVEVHKISTLLKMLW